MKLSWGGVRGLSVRQMSYKLEMHQVDLQGVPLIAASIRLRVGLEGADKLLDWSVTSCSGRRVFPYLITLGSTLVLVEELDADGSYGEISASGVNMSEFRVWKP